MPEIVINERFIREEERVIARDIARACAAGVEPDFKRIERRAYAETVDRAIKRGGKI